jgi:hypothetical protein
VIQAAALTELDGLNTPDAEGNKPQKFPARETRKFKPPSSGRGNDWILVLDDASKNFKTPGF